MSGTQTAIFFLLFMSITKIFGFHFCPLDRQQTTDNRQQTTDGQIQILNPALGMRARGKKNGKSS